MTCFSGSQSWHIWMGTHSYVPWLSKKWNDVHDMQWRTWHACTWHEMKWRTWNDVHDIKWRTWHAKKRNDVQDMLFWTPTSIQVHGRQNGGPRARSRHLNKCEHSSKVWMRHVSRICISPVTRRAQSWHIWMGDWYTLMNEWMNEWMQHMCTQEERCEWVMSRICISPVTRRSESCRIWDVWHHSLICKTYASVLSHVGLSHVTYE